MEKSLRMQIIGLERHRDVNERLEWLGTEDLDDCEEDKAREYAEWLREQPYPEKTKENLRREVAERGLIGIKTKGGMKPYLSAEGAINQFRKDYPKASIDLEMIEFDDQKALFKAEISNDETLLGSGYGMRKASDRNYFEKAQTSAIQRALKAIGYNTHHELAELSEQGYDMLSISETSTTAAITSDTVKTEHESASTATEDGYFSSRAGFTDDIDLIDLANQTRRRTKPASEKQISIVANKADAKTIRRYFGKNAHNLTDGEANLAIKTIFGDIDWKDVERILSM